jgi:hypothetical protein
MYKAVLEKDPDNFIIGDYAYFLHRRKRAYDDAERQVYCDTCLPQAFVAWLEPTGMICYMES